MATLTTLRFGPRDLELGGRYLTTLRDSTGLAGQPPALRARLAEDGYLLIRGLHDRAEVLEARARMLETIAGKSPEAFAPGHAPADALINRAQGGGAFLGGAEATQLPAYRAVVDGRRTMDFFSRLFGEPALTFDYKWLRLVGLDSFTGAHFDNVYMSRGSERLLSMWTPLGDVPFEQGPLAVLAGSHNLPGFARVRSTYGQMDVDRDRVGGWFSNDPVELVDRFGGCWATSEFEAGDALIFGMYTMHGSLTNVSDRYRLSCDTRYQPAADPADERWVGEKPKAHYNWSAGPQVPMEEKRREWGV
jgi:hypothetical protein